MRVTQGMLSNNMLKNLFNNQAKLDKHFEQLYTGKKVNRPSDDPVVAMKGMTYRGQLLEIEQFKRNTGEVTTWMDNSDSALDQSTKAMHRLRDLAVSAGNAAYGSNELASIKAEAEQIKQDLIDIANTKVNDKYIFNGTDTDTPPITRDEDGNIEEITHHSDAVIVEVASGISLKTNVDGAKVFGEDLFEDIDQFLNALEGSEGEEVDIGSSLEAIDKQTSDMVNARADLGARMNRLDLVVNRLEEQEVIATKTMSENEDIHFEEAITNLLTQESLYRASLSAGSRIIQPSLIDFLR